MTHRHNGSSKRLPAYAVAIPQKLDVKIANPCGIHGNATRLFPGIGSWKHQSKRLCRHRGRTSLGPFRLGIFGEELRLNGIFP